MASKSGSGAEAKTSASSSSALSRATGEGKTGHDVGAGGEGAHRFVEDEEEDENDVDFRSGDLGDEVYCVYDDDEAWPRRLGGDEVELAEQFFDAVECGECDEVVRLLEELAEHFCTLFIWARQELVEHAEWLSDRPSLGNMAT